MQALKEASQQRHFQKTSNVTAAEAVWIFV